MKKQTLAICEAGIMIALSTVLAMLKLIDMPYGGSVTFAQMLPILIYAYRHGAKYGMGAALTASVCAGASLLVSFSVSEQAHKDSARTAARAAVSRLMLKHIVFPP